MYNIAESVFKYSAYLTHRLFNKVNTINDFFPLKSKVTILFFWISFRLFIPYVVYHMFML